MDIIDLIFRNRQVFNCTCTAFEKMLNQLNSESGNSSDNTILLQYGIPLSIQETFNISNKFIKLIDDAISIVPIGVNEETHNLMVNILTRSKWYDMQFDDVAKDLLIAESSYYRLKKSALESYYDNLRILFNQHFEIKSYDNSSKDFHNIKKLMKIWESVNYQSNNPTALKERMEMAANIEDVMNIVSENNYYLMFLLLAIKELRGIGPDGPYYYIIANAMLEKKSKEELGYNLRNYKLKYIERKKVNKLIDITENTLGIILFGINYLTIKEGYYIVEK